MVMRACSILDLTLPHLSHLPLTPDPSTGATTTHKYLKGKMLGKGGFAKVYWCTSLDSNKSYAIKIVPKANLVKSRARQKLQAEIKIHRVLKHRRIVEYKHFFEDRTNCYILLELCHNQSMNELIKRRKRLTEPEVLFYMMQLIDGTRYMHTNNVIHRDLKVRFYMILCDKCRPLSNSLPASLIAWSLHSWATSSSIATSA